MEPSLFHEAAMHIKDIMTAPVSGIEPDMPLAQAVEVMLRERISGLPVIKNDGTLVGILSEGDLVRRAELGTIRKPRWIELLFSGGRLAERYAHDHGRKVREVMTTEVRTLSETADLNEAVELMQRHRIKRLPVVVDGRVVGIVTRADILRALAGVFPQLEPPLSDAAIRERILRELEAQPWAPLATLRVDVQSGVVTFKGAITDYRSREALRVLAENIPGVTFVHDRLVWVEPVSGTVIAPENDHPLA
jgi:CBS domain-containing protein